MSHQTSERAVEKRLAVYNPDNSINGYLNAVSELSTVSFAAILGKLEDKHELSLEKIKEWRNSFGLKREDAEVYVETEKLRVGAENSSAAANIANIKQTLTEDLSTTKARNKILRERNARLRDMNSHIDLVNEQIEDMQKTKSRLSAPQEEWEKRLGARAVAQMLRARVFRRQMVKVREDDADVEYEELSVQANFSKSAPELERTNESMKQSIRRLQQELHDYQDKWSHNAQLFDRIADVLQDELAIRNVVTSAEKNFQIDEHRDKLIEEQDQEPEPEAYEEDDGDEEDEEEDDDVETSGSEPDKDDDDDDDDDDNNNADEND
ncbi:LAFA_0G13102g1_1 [Lachancea sp. 'fantastica']|nr:LAFA_0G13102g1_1 [Lachancea sp. 'fantastica']